MAAGSATGQHTFPASTPPETLVESAPRIRLGDLNPPSVIPHLHITDLPDVDEKMERFAVQARTAQRAAEYVRGRLPHPREKGERRHRSVAGRPAESGQQALLDLRRTRLPAQGHHHRQRQRRHPDPRPGRRHPSRIRASRPATPPPRFAARRQGLRRQPPPRGAAQAPNPAGHLPQGRPEHQRAWARSATSWSRPSPCSTSSNASPSAGNAEPNSTTPSPHWPAASSAGGD